MQSRAHWERIYATKAAQAVSWYQPHATRSLALIRGSAVPRTASIIDVGGGASTLVDDLLADGYSSLTVLDLSATALEAARQRLGSRADAVRWLVGDVATVELAEHSFDVWHDRALFHFLTEEQDRKAYVAKVVHSLEPHGHVIIATFAEDGPTQCSGLPVVRYSPEELHAQFGEAFTLLEQRREAHATPSAAVQKFIYCHFRLAQA